MPIKYDPNRTDAYVGTFYPENPDDMQQLEDLKDIVRNINKMLSDSNFDYKFRVSVKPRLGKNSPYSEEYRKKGWGGYQSIKMEHGAYYDAYIHRRYD